MQDNQADQIEPTPQHGIEALERAQIDIQIATSKRFPRPINSKLIAEQVMLHATVNEATATDCYYAIPRRQKQADGTYKVITINGPSVRLSEIVAACYKNLHIIGRISDHDFVTRTVTAQAVAWDLENNVRRTAEWSETVTMGSSDGAKMTKLSAISKAERNAIFKVVPRTIWEPALARCMVAATGDSASLAQRLTGALKAFEAMGVSQQQIFNRFGYAHLHDFNQLDLANLLGFHTAIKEGSSSIDEIFGTVDASPKTTSQSASVQTQALAMPPLEPARRRGRPPGSKNKEKDTDAPHDSQPQSESTADNSQESAAQSPDETVQNTLQFPTSSENDPRSIVITEIRAKLKGSNKTEERLLAKLHEWHFGGDDPASSLEDFLINELEMINKRWSDQVLPNL